MRKIMLLAVVSMSTSVAFADGGGVLQCGTDTAFHGIVEQIKSGNCTGQWSINLGDKSFVPLGLPVDYQREGARVMGCLDYSEARPYCSISGALAEYAHIKKIFPDNP